LRSRPDNNRRQAGCWSGNGKGSSNVRRTVNVDRCMQLLLKGTRLPQLTVFFWWSQGSNALLSWWSTGPGRVSRLLGTQRVPGTVLKLDDEANASARPEVCPGKPKVKRVQHLGSVPKACRVQSSQRTHTRLWQQSTRHIGP